MGIASSWATTYFSFTKTILSNTLQINNSLNLQFTLICVRIKIKYFCHTFGTSFFPPNGGESISKLYNEIHYQNTINQIFKNSKHMNT